MRDAQASLDRVGDAVSGRTGKRVHWNRGGAEDAQVESVRQLLQRALTAERAVQIALLNNRELQARFEEIGIAQADLVEAGLLSNPSLAASFRFPSRPPSGTNIEYSVAQNFLELLVLPLRKRVAAAQLAQTETRVADAVLKLAAEVKVAFYTAQARGQLLGRLRVITETNETAAEFTKRLHDAGNMSDLELANQQGSYEQSRLEVAQTELQLRRDREQAESAPGSVGTEHELDHGRSSARDSGARSRSAAPGITRDRAAPRSTGDAACNSISSGNRSRSGRRRASPRPPSNSGSTPNARPTASASPDPTLDLELPIFNQGQGEIAKLTAQYRQAQHELEAAAVNIRSEVREARDQLVAARDLTSDIGKRLLPTQQQALNLTLQQYNYMLKGAYDLLAGQAKRSRGGAELHRSLARLLDRARGTGASRRRKPRAGKIFPRGASPNEHYDYTT